MSLHPQPIPPTPEETVRAAQAAFAKGNLYLTLRDKLGTLYEDDDFGELYPQRGQPAHSPWRLALITIVQFVKNLSDRQAADAVRARIDWKYLLSLPLSDSGFDFSVLSEFRARLNVLATVAPKWLLGIVEADWFERYSERIESFRLPKLKERDSWMLKVGLASHPMT